MARHRERMHQDEEEQPVPLTTSSLHATGRLLRYLRPYWPKLLVAHLALLISSSLGLAFPYATGQLVNSALQNWDQQVSEALLNKVDTVALVLVGILALKAAFSFIETLWLIEVGERSLADLRRDTYARLIRLPMTFHNQRRVGELGSRLAADLAEIQDTLVGDIPRFLHHSIMMIGGVVLILCTSLQLTLVMLASFPVLILVAVLFGRALRKISRDAQDRLAETNVVVEETLQGITSVKAFTNERFEEQRYHTGLQGFLKIVLRGAKYRGAFLSFVVFALFGSIVLVLWYGARLVLNDTLSAGALTSFMLYTLFVGGAVGSFADLYTQIQRTLGATTRIRELLDEEPEPFTPAVEQGEGAIPRFQGDVAFEQVSFSYPSRKEMPVLREVSLVACPGERIALVGPSGAGKSTIVSLLLRFYEPDQGRILVDGKDVREHKLHALRGQMAIVPQDVLLFGGTIHENIAYGRPGASDSEVEEAARQANAHDFIMSFPDGYQTRVGERGVQLSGGQRQRVAIARAILRDPAILLLDEATSSLDAESEHLVLEALDRLMQGRTSLIITHRLSTVRRADRIVVLQEGQTVEEGTHEALLSRPGVYQMLLEMQENGKKVGTWHGGAGTPVADAPGSPVRG